MSFLFAPRFPASGNRTRKTSSVLGLGKYLNVTKDLNHGHLSIVSRHCTFNSLHEDLLSKSDIDSEISRLSSRAVAAAMRSLMLPVIFDWRTLLQIHGPCFHFCSSKWAMGKEWLRVLGI